MSGEKDIDVLLKTMETREKEGYTVVLEKEMADILQLEYSFIAS